MSLSVIRVGTIQGNPLPKYGIRLPQSWPPTARSRSSLNLSRPTITNGP
ncbi:hypothetical protein FOCG_17391 [Fusarium oxysporum f. sp. radicis-lycopersici 26381]|nr:hypothetical protein FOCG_17391 [Fusarium oxysporum f. sp. radicis-lycopersici 26381]